ncbi:MAG TPA: enoyl-CoA hydratase-related protein, partial [Dehalococcoidia bacterium]|nr:enoyl-CoA hydratase-related protein [Dehalococcoidia bacterium]
MAEYSQILYERIGRVGRVTLNRPQVYNAQSRLMREEMDAAFAEAIADPEVHVIVLAGAGQHFSAGHDLGTPEEREDQQRRPYPPGVPGQFERGWMLNVDNSLRWRELPKPTIAAVQGYCIYGGWILASAMDLIVAADDAKFLPGMTQYATAPWDLGVRKAKEILFQSRFVDADEALRLGFVCKVVPRAVLEQETLAFAEAIADSHPFFVRMVTFSINRAQDMMGFRNHALEHFPAYMTAQLAGTIGGPREGEQGEGRRRRALPAV